MWADGASWRVRGTAADGTTTISTTRTFTVDPDIDDDGVSVGAGDCDDADPAVHPGAEDICNDVDDDCDGVVDPGLLVPSEYATIQDGIDAAGDGDLVCVAAGTYSETIDFGGTDVVVQGAGGVAGTVIDGGGAGPVVRFDSGETEAATLEGFTVTGGLDYWTDAGGIYVYASSPTLVDLEISGNQCYDYYSCDAAGLMVVDGAPYVGDVLIADNDCWSARGPSNGCGISARDSDLVLERVTVARNTANAGWASSYVTAVGVRLLDCDAVVSHLTVADNVSNAKYTSAAGLMVMGGAPVFENLIVAGNRVEGTDAVWAGGVGVVTEEDTTATFINASIVGNVADVSDGVEGAGWANYEGGLPLLINVDISDNLEISTSTEGAGIHQSPDEGSVTLRNCNLWGNSSAVVGMDDPTGTDGNLAADPSYVDTSGTSALDWDLHLDEGSALIDAGDPTILDADGTTSDIGAQGGPGGSW